MHDQNTPFNIPTESSLINNGFILDPVIFSPSNTIKDIIVHRGQFKYEFSSYPITEDGTLGSKLVGIISRRDTDFIENLDTKIETIMTKDFVTAKNGCSLKDANNILKQNKVNLLPIVDNEMKLINSLCSDIFQSIVATPIRKRNLAITHIFIQTLSLTISIIWKNLTF